MKKKGNEEKIKMERKDSRGISTNGVKNDKGKKGKSIREQVEERDRQIEIQQMVQRNKNKEVLRYLEKEIKKRKEEQD